MPSENTIELYDLSPQRMVALPLTASRVTCVQNDRDAKSDTCIFTCGKSRIYTATRGVINNSNYVCVVLWSGVGFGFIQCYDEQAALDGFQDGFVVRIDAY